MYGIGNGQSQFGSEVRQMLPPYMTDDANTVERLLANMDFAQVSAAVVTQEYIDGNQDAYLRHAREQHGERLRVCALYEEEMPLPHCQGMDGIKICAGRLKEQNLAKHEKVFEWAWQNKLFISIDLADGDLQTASLREMIQAYPKLRIAIGHFGMVTTRGWEEQIRLARFANVFVESGGITWLFHNEFYPYPSAVDAVIRAGEICGMEKLMWGSDYPRTMTAITYSMSWDFVERSTKMKQEDKERFLYQNALGFYRFPLFAEMPRIKHMLE